MKFLCGWGTIVACAFVFYAHSFQKPFSTILTLRKRSVSSQHLYSLPLPGVGEDGCKLPSPSKINTLPILYQAAVFWGSYGAMFVGSVVLVTFLNLLLSSFPAIQAWEKSWFLLGLVYAAAGWAHFGLKEDFINTMPYRGAWGLWYLPGSAEFHVLWTGVAEMILGTGLFLGGLANVTDFALLAVCKPLESISAFALLLLTVAVTPANIFMFTHGAKLPIESPEVPVAGHLLRGVLQMVLYAFLFELGAPTFEAITKSL